MGAAPLPTVPPSATGVDARGLLDLLDALEALPGLEMHGLMVLRHGQVLARGWWSPFTAERPHLLYSLSKSFTATALGFAVAEGLVGLDDLVVDHFPELEAEVTDPGSRAIRVRHAASMATGHTDDMWDVALDADWAEPVRGFLLRPPHRAPGTVFAYNQPATYCVAAIVQRATGQTLVDYLRPRLLDPLGIGPVGWQQHPRGRDLGFTGLHATTDAVARLGQLYLQRGAWRGQQLLSPDWVAEASRSDLAKPAEP
jgi:CubicO group peptidase (beta-lactamase class C family)